MKTNKPERKETLAEEAAEQRTILNRASHKAAKEVLQTAKDAAKQMIKTATVASEAVLATAVTTAAALVKGPVPVVDPSHSQTDAQSRGK